MDNSLKTYTVESNRLKGMNIYTSYDYFNIVYSAGEYDEEMFSSIEKNNPKNKTIFDVGGFMGVNSIIFSRLVGENGKVLVFEPNPWNLERIEKNLSLNEVEAKTISLNQLAFSNTITKQKMLVSKLIDTGYSSTSQLLSAHGTVPQDDIRKLGFEEIEVNVTTLDEFVEKSELVPDIIKVDIEGVEHLFIEGALKTLKDHTPDLYIELHSTYCAVKCTEILTKFNYEINILKKEPDGRLIVHCTCSKANENITIIDSKDFIKSRLEELSIDVNQKFDDISKTLSNIESQKKRKSFLKRIFRK